MTSHSTFVRSLLLLGWRVTASLKRAAHVTMIGTGRPDSKVEVILGVDTHLDFHVAVAVDHPGRRLDEPTVPTTAKGYEGLLSAGRRALAPCGAPRRSTSQGAPLAKPGKSKPEIVRCLERYVAREVYRVLVSCVARSSPIRP